MKSAALVTVCLQILLGRSVQADLPRAPVFSVSPKKDVYTRGESVELKCSSSETRHVSRTQFFRDHQDLHSVKPSSPSSLNNVTHTLRLVIQDGGDYSCRYHIVESGREIASRESNSIRISLLVLPPPAPELSIIPPRQTFLQGQRIKLKCSHPEGQPAAKFFFYELKADGNYTRPQEQFNNTLEITAGFQEIKKTFVCAYLEESSAGQLSERSNHIEVSIIDRLRPPFFSVSPKLDIYSSGEIVNLTCSAPENLLMSRVLFGKDRWLLNVYRPPSPLASFTYTRRLSPQDSGDHFCTYRAAESSWNISSPESRRIRISVMARVAPPPAPVLTVDPPSGVVKEGGFLRLTCSAIGSDAEQRFHFYKDGVKISSSSQESLADSGEPRNAFSNASADILVQVTASIHTGGFACRYEQKLSSRWIMSPWSQTVKVTALVAPPPAPVLTVDPPSGVVKEGGFLRLTCSAIGSDAEQRFHFYKDGVKISSSSQESLVGSREPRNAFSNASADILVQVTASNHTGEFACRYEQKLSGRWIMSPWSQTVNVTDPPPAPVLTVDPPSGVVKEGGFLRLTCSAIGSDAEQRFHFYKDGVKISSSSQESLADSGEPRNAFSNASADILVQVTASIHTGGFACRYEQKLSSRWIMSPWSQTVKVTDPPPAPVLTVDPPSGVVKEGGFLRLTCSAIGSDAEQRFHFYKDGVKISSSSQESLADSGEPRNAFSNASADILVQVTASIHTGGFACRYEQKLSSRWIMSPWSQTVNVTGQLPDSFATSVGHAWWASLLLIPVVLFAYYCWRKKGILFALGTSKYQLASETKESKEETSQDMFGLLVPQKTDFQVKSSDITYATIASSPAVTPSEPTLKDDPISAKDEEVLYSDLLFHPQKNHHEAVQERDAPEVERAGPV